MHYSSESEAEEEEPMIDSRGGGVTTTSLPANGSSLGPYHVVFKDGVDRKVSNMR